MWPGHPPLGEGNRRSLHRVDYLFSVLTISDWLLQRSLFWKGLKLGLVGVFLGGRGGGGWVGERKTTLFFFLIGKNQNSFFLNQIPPFLVFHPVAHHYSMSSHCPNLILYIFQSSSLSFFLSFLLLVLSVPSLIPWDITDIIPDKPWLYFYISDFSYLVIFSRTPFPFS